MSPRSGFHPDFFYGLVLLAIGGGLFLHTFSDRYDFDLLFGDVSTIFFPRIVLILWMGLSAILIVNGARGRGDTADRKRLAAIALPRLTIVLGVTIATAVFLWAAGLLIGGPVLMISIGIALGYRRWIALVPFSIALPVAVWIALSKVAKIALPAGVLWD